MGRRLENLEQFGIDVVLERRRGFRASILRGILYAFSFVYERLVQLRLYLYRKTTSSRARARLSCHQHRQPDCRRHGQNSGSRKIRARVAIWRPARCHSEPRLQERSAQTQLARSTCESKMSIRRASFRTENRCCSTPLIAGDEPYMLAHNLKDVIVLVDKDRVKSGRFRHRQMESRHTSARRWLAISASQTSARHRAGRSASAVWK